jgi:hypothetical protein
MKTSPITLEIKSDLSEITEAMEKLRAIADILPVTVANFIAGAGGITGLVEQRIAPPTEGVAWFLARPTDKLQRFLAIFDDDDLAAVPAEEKKSDEAKLTTQQNREIVLTLCAMSSQKMPSHLTTIRQALIAECEAVNLATSPSSLSMLHTSL